MHEVRTFCSRAIVAAFMAWAALQMVAPASAVETTVTGIRMGENAGTTRLVLDLDQAVTFKTLLLDKPYRIVLDLPEVRWAVKGGGAAGIGAVQKYRYGLFRDGVSRLVLDLSEAAVIQKAFLLPPQGSYGHRLVIDLKPTDGQTFAAAMKASRKGDVVRRAASDPAPAIQSDRGERNHYRIVVDAGHGGIDPGNLGVIGVPEKTIVLNIAKALKTDLERSDKYQVFLTRDRDVFIPLTERPRLARKFDGDLFISIHADSLQKSKKNAQVRGATVYTLSERASDAEAAALASKENKSDLIAGIDLEAESDEVASILIDLAQRETMNYSAQFANLLIPELKGRVYLRKNTHRFAGFVVLKAPDIPSVLVETGYLSNQNDAKFLNSRDGRQQVSGAIASAVRRYFDATSTASAY